jgi:phosphomannomutase
MTVKVLNEPNTLNHRRRHITWKASSLKPKLFRRSGVHGLTNVKARPILAAQIGSVVARLKEVFPTYVNSLTIDGFRLTLKHGWAVIRAPRTEPSVRLTSEGESLRTAKEIMEESTRLVRECIGEKEK